MSTDKDIERLAGIINNKGSVSIGLDNFRGKQYYYEQFRLSGDLTELAPFKEIFGGSISSNGSHCKMIWRITADRALKMFLLVLPHLTGRRLEVVKMVIDFGQSRHEVAQEIIQNGENHAQKKLKLVEKANELRNLLREAS